MTAAGQDRLDRAAAALRPYLPATSDDKLRALAAAAEPTEQDGEQLRLLTKAAVRYLTTPVMTTTLTTWVTLSA